MFTSLAHSKTLPLAAGLLSVSLLSGCATGGLDTQTAKGALIGAVAGAAAGSTSGDKKGSLYGAIAGALLGGAVGNYMDAQQREIEDELAAEVYNREVEITRLQNETLQVSLTSKASFDINSTDLKQSFYPTLEKLSHMMGKYDQTALHIVGHTDNTGSDAYNQGLSRNRAVSVARYLTGNGVDRQRLNVEGRGELYPRASNSTNEGRRTNRRVEIYIKPIVEGNEQEAFEPPVPSTGYTT